MAHAIVRTPLLGFEPLGVKQKTLDKPGIFVLCGERGSDETLRASPFRRTRFARRPGSIAAGRTLLSDSHHSQCKKQNPGIFRGIVFYAEREGFEPSIALVRTMTV